ncbi:heat shock protein Hsp20 [Malonomonas rubra DSM 5091]|uniref:Heat shock protein Hsp20 n=1 Tax=Malonomonas rubra DSM 5091 TaxID=1122189 RepID=A0A1M6NW95_MALRU|nr:Hsp20/alpha crystallin family protein [Malonomonas rubra]SHJ99894.1 heat shock protein Hsp20 [Malonomonas rubra DSM 5091]
MKLTRWDPLRDVDEFFDRALSWPLRRQIQGTLPTLDEEWAPRVDISETDNNFLIKAEIPGIKREDVKINIEDNVLTIHGERKEEKEEKGRKFHRVECRYGSFSRSFTLPQNTQMDHVEATFKDGILNLQIPKKQAEKSKQIEVKIH